MKAKLFISALMLTTLLQAQNSITPTYSGQVTDGNNNPVNGAQVTIINNCNNQSYQVNTNPNGWFTYQQATFTISQQCQVIFIAEDSSGNCLDTVAIWLHPGMSGNMNFTVNLQLSCSNSGSGNCNIAWGFNTNPANACQLNFWHQGNAATWYFYNSNNTVTTSTDNFPTYGWNAPGTYQVCIEFPNCAPQCTTATITPNCIGNNNCNTAWGFTADSSCGYTFWHQGTPGSAFWQVTGNNNAYQSSTLDFPTLTFSEPGMHIVELYLNNCYYVDTLYVDASCAGSNGCNTAWGFSPVPNNACAYQFWHQGASAVWTFSNNTSTFTTTQNSPFFTWSTAGTYQVCVQFPNCAPQCTTITVTPNCTGNNTTCNAYFTWYIDPATNETFINNLSTGSPIQYSWNYGDGNTGFGYNPSHTYNSGGWYEICLTIGTPNTPACYDTYCDSVFIPSAQLRINGPATLDINESEIGWTLYPNPVVDQLNIQFIEIENTEIAIEVFSISGGRMIQLAPQMIYSGSILSLPVESLSSGVYMVRVTEISSGRNWIKKFMK